MRYVKKSCSKCGYPVQPWSHYTGSKVFDCPISMCPACKSILIDRSKKEFIMVGTDADTYCKKCMLGTAFNILLPFIMGIIAWTLAGEFNVIATLALLASYAAVWFLCYLFNKKYYKEEAEKSIQRTKEKAYLDVLLSTDLIDKNTYDRFIKTYGIEKTNKKPSEVIDHYEDEVIFDEIEKMKKKNGGKPLNLSKENIKDIEKKAKERLKKCPNCRAKLNDDDAFCSKCGYKLYKKN